ncbi:MAG: hypothetical protein IPJ66_20470 [Bacteroidetes bacterium]|nr:hypothetical protein [Bacteroidota bacterium]
MKERMIITWRKSAKQSLHLGDNGENIIIRSFPNSFYSGNTDIEPYGIGNPEKYYAWTWGDALLVVLDVCRDENVSPPKTVFFWVVG